MTSHSQRYVCRRFRLLTIAVVLSCFVAGFMEAALCWGAEPNAVRRITVVTGNDSSPPVKSAARILAARVRKRSDVAVRIVDQNEPKLPEAMQDADLVVVIGTPDTCALTKDTMAKLGANLPTLPNSQTVHRESFAIKSGVLDGKRHLLIAAAEPRAAIYGVGAALRAMTYQADAVQVPEFDMQEKPAFWMRGGQPTGPGSRDRQYGKLRPRSSEEQREVMEDLMLLGTNVFEGTPATMADYGMLTRFGRTANEMPAGFPKEWGADGGRSRKHVCPSVPEARAALLDSYEKMFRDSADYDFFTTNSGDVGGCRCEKCMPWGGVYIELVHEIAQRLHKYHPRAKILATNQDLTNEGNQQIIDYLNGHGSSWLYALRYGPGADEMQTYIRGPVNPARFDYEGFGPSGNYLKYLHRNLPRETNIALYTDITHWMQAQYAVPKPDIALAAVYDRRSWNARPRHFHKVAQEILHYAVGDIHYSEGMHDEFNKWVWYRLLWNPHQTPEELTNEYCRYWFGPEAQDEMAEAIFLMEETLEKPVLGNAGIQKAVELLEAAGQKIPANLLRADYRWRVISQKAFIDRYIQLMLERGQELRNAATPILGRAQSSSSPSDELNEALKVLAQPPITDQMKDIMQRAQQRGEESNEIAGYRIASLFVVDTLDLTEVGWWKKTVEEAIASGNDSRMRNDAKMLLQYENPGEGGFYDDLGWPNASGRLTHGESLWGFSPFSGPAKRSHYNLAYSFFDPQGVSLAYEGLNPEAQYVLRVSIGFHAEDGEASNMFPDVELKQGVKADGQVVSEGFVIPRGSVTIQEFDVPVAVTADGKVEITFTNSSKVLPVTAAYEVWLMRKDQMPWTVR